MPSGRQPTVPRSSNDDVREAACKAAHERHARDLGNEQFERIRKRLAAAGLEPGRSAKDTLERALRLGRQIFGADAPQPSSSSARPPHLPARVVAEMRRLEQRHCPYPLFTAGRQAPTGAYPMALPAPSPSDTAAPVSHQQQVAVPNSAFQGYQQDLGAWQMAHSDPFPPGTAANLNHHQQSAPTTPAFHGHYFDNQSGAFAMGQAPAAYNGHSAGPYGQRQAETWTEDKDAPADEDIFEGCDVQQ